MATHPMKSRCRIKSFVVSAKDRPMGVYAAIAHCNRDMSIVRDLYEMVGHQDRGNEGHYFKYEIVKRGV